MFAGLSFSRTRALVFTSIAHFVNDGSVFFLPLVVDLLASLKGATPLEVSVLLFLFNFSSMAASVFVGRQADRTGAPGRLMALGVGFLGLGLIGFYAIIIYTAGDELFVLALLCDFIMGFGSSFYHPLGGSILQASFGRETTGRALGLNGALGSAGRTLYPLFFAAAAAFTASGALGFFGFVGLGAGLLIWVGLRRAERGRPKAGSPRSSLRSELTKPMVMLLGISFVRSAALFGVAAYVPVFLTTQRALGVGSLLGVSLAAFYASAIIGQPFFGMLADRLDRRLVLTITAVGAASALVGSVSSSGVTSIALLSLFGFFAYTGFPLLMALASDYTAREASALGNSLVWGLGATGGNAVGPLLVCAVALNDYSELGFSFEVMAILAVASGVGALMIPKPTNRADRASQTP